MSRNVKALHERVRSKRLLLNTNKVEAALCILLSAALSISFFAWLFI